MLRLPPPTRCAWGAAILLAILLAARPAQADEMTFIHSFSGSDGKSPVGAIAKSGSSLYGVANQGGTSNTGTIYKVDTNGGNFQALRSFGGAEGFPSTGLTLDGSTLYGGMYGSIYSIQPDGSNYQPNAIFLPTDPINFSQPAANLRIQGGKVFGIATGSPPDFTNEAFQASLSSSSSYTTRHVFNSVTDGVHGIGPVGTPATDGTSVFGATLSGGSATSGVIYKYAISGGASTFQTVLDFAAIPGAAPSSGLTLVGSTLYGQTSQGGDHANGIIFKVDVDGNNFQVLHSFVDGPGAQSGAMTYTGSALVGTTNSGGDYNKGSLFSINLDGSNFQTLFSFGGNAGEGFQPTEGAVVYDYPYVYGATSMGGANGMGTVWAYSLAVPEPSTFVLGGVALLGLAVFALRKR